MKSHGDNLFASKTLCLDCSKFLHGKLKASEAVLHLQICTTSFTAISASNSYSFAIHTKLTSTPLTPCCFQLCFLNSLLNVLNLIRIILSFFLIHITNLLSELKVCRLIVMNWIKLQQKSKKKKQQPFGKKIWTNKN